MGAIDYVVDSLVGANGPLGLNHLMNMFTNNTGEIIIPDVAAFFPKIHLAISPEYQMLVGEYNVTIGIYSLNITGLNTWTDVGLFDPIDNYTLGFDAGLSHVGLSAHIYVDVVDMALASTGGPMPSWHEEVILKANLSNTAFHGLVFAGLSSSGLQRLSANQLTSPGCLLKNIRVIEFLVVTFNFSVSGIEIVPIIKSSKSQADWLIINFADIVLVSLVPAMPAAFNFLFNGVLLMLANPGLAIFLKEYPAHCIPAQGIDTNTFNQNSTFFSFIGAAGLFLIIGASSFAFRSKLGKNSLDEAEPLFKSSRGRSYEKGSEVIILSDEIHFLVRYGVLALLLANIALFISSNTSVGASVYLVIKAEGQQSLDFPSLFDFSLVNSVKDMWNAGVYPLSILIAVFSGFWPYCKLAMLIGCWVIPFRGAGLKHRERALLVLDALGKCSLIDSFVMILMMVAFHFSISPPVTQYTPAGSFVVQTWVEPHYGFYSFIGATILSLLTTHVIVYCHRKTTNEGEFIHIDDKKSLLAYSRRTGNIIFVISIPILLIIATALVILGLSIASFEFEFKGAFGYLLTLINLPTTTSYSVFSLGSGIPSASDDPRSFGILFLQVSFFIFVCAMPLLYLVLLVLLWLWPLTYHAQRKLLHITEIAQAWASLEVFIVAVIAALVELQQFAQFILGHRCDKINPYLQKYAPGLLDGDDKCFDVAAYLKMGCWVTFSACIIYLIVGVVVIKRCHKALSDRGDDIRGPTIQ